MPSIDSCRHVIFTMRFDGLEGNLVGCSFCGVVLTIQCCKAEKASVVVVSARRPPVMAAGGSAAPHGDVSASN